MCESRRAFLFNAAVKALDKRASEMMTQRMLDPTDETNSAIPCPSRLVVMATIARTKVATKKTNPRIRRPTSFNG
jgi:hypothetical protein